MIKNEPEKIKIIIDMYNNNFKYEDIAKEVNCSMMAVYSYVKKVLIPNKLIEPRITIKGKKG